ncbi:ACT domain-containing protein [Candidatus Bathyarchaeota archaeon]|nr:ACT domain-containing protein [Candidatus Bathyarchaeota archaeon]
MPRVTQLVVTSESKPGTLAQLCSTLSKAGVNIRSMLAPEIRGRGKVRLLVDDPAKAKDALKAAKIRFSEEEVLELELDNRPGSLGEVAEKLAKAKINIKYAYATTSEGSAKATVVLAVPNLAKAAGVLGE